MVKTQYLIYAGLGFIGAIIKDILDDGGISMPKFKDGKMVLGFIGSGLIGAVVACIADNDPLTAITSGFMSMSLITNIMHGKKDQVILIGETTEEMVRRIAKDNCVDPELAVKVAKCESGLNPKAINTNTDGSRDRGLFQINEKYHPEVTDTQAFDVAFSTKFFCDAQKAGFISWWNASKKCWGG
jgi:hypothetical protein